MTTSTPTPTPTHATGAPVASVAPAGALAAGVPGGLLWAIPDAWTMTRRNLALWLRQPAQVLIGLLFPVMTVLLFGYLFGGGMTLPGGGDYRAFLVPGMFAMAMLFGLETTFAAVSSHAARGVTDRFRSLPMAGSAVVTGRAVADMLYAATGLAVMVGAGLAIGWRWEQGIGRALAAFGLLLLLRFALLWVGIFLALVVESPEMLVAIQILVWPLGFLSNAFAAPATMPGWLGTVAAWNPLSSTVAAGRALFGNPDGGGESWIAQHAVPMAVVWPLLIVAVFFPLSVRRYRRLGR